MHELLLTVGIVWAWINHRDREQLFMASLSLLVFTMWQKIFPYLTPRHQVIWRSFYTFWHFTVCWAPTSPILLGTAMALWLVLGSIMIVRINGIRIGIQGPGWAVQMH